MPKYQVNLYNVYLEAFEVEAPSAAEAQELAYAYQYVMGMPYPGELEEFAGRVTHVTQHAYQYEEDPEVFVVAPTGEFLPLEDGAAAEETTP